MNEVQKLLSDAKALISTPEKWCRGRFAENMSGETVDWGHPDACRWDMFGALARAGQRASASASLGARSSLGDAIRSPLFAWHDAPERTHAEVMAAFDRAIELAGRSA